MTFDGLGLSPELLRAVADQGYTEPTPVQLAAIPLVLAGRDVLAGAQTGTGKTAAFVLPIINNLHATRNDGPGRHPVRVLVIVPTRELAIQVEESVRTYGVHRPVRSATVYGGVGFGPQVSKLRAGPEVVVATPGRLLDHIAQRTIDLSKVEVLVLDEADRMLDMGFIRDIRKILALLPQRRQNLLFSATFSDDIRGLADGLLHEPASVQVTPRNTTTELIDQLVIPVDRERKRDLLRELVALGRVKQALVFTRTKHGANRLAQQLDRDGISAAAIHGNRSQSQRVRALEDFKNGRVSMLVATDIAARGLDIEQLPHVVNFELPMVAEDYVHRIGRTGRAGETGQAISLVCVDEAPLLRQVQQLLGRVIPSEKIAGFEPDGRVRAEPIRLRSTPAERAETRANRAPAAGRSGGGRQVRPAGDEGVAPGRRPGPAAEERVVDGRIHASGDARRQGRPGAASSAAGAGTGGGSAYGQGAAKPRGEGRGGGRGRGSAPHRNASQGRHASQPRTDGGSIGQAQPRRDGQPRRDEPHRSAGHGRHDGQGERPAQGQARRDVQGHSHAARTHAAPPPRAAHPGDGRPRALPGERLHALGGDR
jgi:ATP-dependent RNA helicase RhlE